MRLDVDSFCQAHSATHLPEPWQAQQQDNRNDTTRSTQVKNRRKNHPCMSRMPVAPAAPTTTAINPEEEWVLTDEDIAFAIHIFSQDNK